MIRARMSMLVGLLMVSNVALAQTAYMDFGGMYGYYESPRGTFRTYTNPYTGGASCPSGYTAYGILGTPNLDHSVFFCGRRTTGGTTPVADFGGMYGYYGVGYNSYPYNNPITGGASCPSGYTATVVLGTANLDYPLYYCHRPYNSTSTVQYRLGGMYGYYYSSSTATEALYPNPITGGASCAAGYTNTVVFGTQNIDYPVRFCHQRIENKPLQVFNATASGGSAAYTDCATLRLNGTSHYLGCNKDTTSRTITIPASSSPVCNLIGLDFTANGSASRSTRNSSDLAYMRFTKVDSNTLRIEFEDATDNDFNDFIINLQGLSGLNYGIENSSNIRCY